MAKFLFIIDQLSSGGAPRSVIKLTRALLEQEHRVTLIALRAPVTLPVPEGASVHVVPFAPKGRWEKLRRYEFHARQLDEFLDRLGEAFDLVVANLNHAHQVAARSKLSSKAWLCIRSDPWQRLISHKQGWQRAIKQQKVKALYRNKKILTLTQENVRSLDRIGIQPARAEVIPNLVELEHIRKKMIAPLPEPELEQCDFCLFVGRLNMRQKRLDRLLEGYKASGTEMPLIMVGDGDANAVEEVQTRAAALGIDKQVMLLGSRDNPFPYMHRARLLLLASDYEGLPNVIIEALACGTPVVSTDCLSGPRDILQGKLARGLVTPKEDTAGFGRAISDLLANPPTIDPEALEQYAPATVVSRYLELAEEDAISR
ncbi:glycosyltransferase [Billgrantia antri]|uniref:Glycosyltransferase n=1 Tax=Billgrantia antri TaxID=2846777 RepID=A0ABS6ZPI9_9GAMM|nr:glycosyltransferase [Halomonas antri]MBW6391991.1 glycosyltransferase [Halomonas antri]